MLLTETGAPGAAPSSSSTSTSTADEHARVTSRVAGAGPLHTAESRLSPIVSAETEALMKRLRSASGSVVIAAPTLVATSAGGSAQPPLLGLGGATSFTVGSAPYPNSYGASPSFAELGLTKTAESLAASEGVAAEDANGLIVYGEPGTSLNANALLEAITTLRLSGEVLRHWHRDGQHFCFVEFTRDVDTADVAKRIATLSVGGVTLSAEQCRRITPGRDPRTHRATSEFKSSTLVLKNLPFQLRQETLTEILNRMPCAPASINYHYDTTGAFRGMAFVKYATIDDAYKVFNELNGLDIMGRALRVEYKRHSSATDAPNAAAPSGAPGSHSGSNGSFAQLKGSGQAHHNGRHNAPSAAPQLDPNELSAEARAFYEQLIMFKQNTRLNELAFPPSLTVHQRKQLHFLAEQIGGLAHAAVGEGSARFLVVSKHASPQMSTSAGAANAPSSGTLAAPAVAGFVVPHHQPRRGTHGSGSHNANHHHNHNNQHNNGFNANNGAASYNNNSSYLSRSPGTHSSAAAFGARSWNERERGGKHGGGWGHGKDGGAGGAARRKPHQPHVQSPVGSPDSDSASAAAAAALANDPSLLDDAPAPTRPRSGTGSDAANAVVRQPRGPASDNKGFTTVTRR
jgi:RNA recognition motif-containing protein